MTPTASRPVHNFYVSDPIHPAALAQLQDLGTVYCNFGANPVAFTDVADIIDAVLLRAETFGADKISAAPRLKIIARHGTGTDNVDIAAATAAAVWVTVTPGANSGAVAEHVFALLLALARKTGHASTGTAAGQWSSLKPTLTGFELGGRTLGLVGFGRIARHVGRIARGFGMTVIAADPHVDPESVRAGRRRRGVAARVVRPGRRHQPACATDTPDAAPDQQRSTGRHATGRCADQHLPR